MLTVSRTYLGMPVIIHELVLAATAGAQQQQSSGDSAAFACQNVIRSTRRWRVHTLHPQVLGVQGFEPSGG